MKDKRKEVGGKMSLLSIGAPACDGVICGRRPSSGGVAPRLENTKNRKLGSFF
jgi:hypothetical protein